MIKILVVFIGGGIGSTLRYAVQLLLHEKITYYNFPWATFGVNILGSFLIGLFYVASSKFDLTEEIRLLLTAGLCGGFTTFSTFSFDNFEMLRQGDITMCVIYTFVSIFLGVGACFIGASIVK